MSDREVVFDDTKIKQAMEVLKRVKVLGKNLPKGLFYFDTYQNGRESGFCIRGHVFSHIPGKAFFGGEIFIAFSEYRNSDSIVVYEDSILAGEERRYLTDGLYGGNIPGEKAYKNRVCFDYEHYDEAAKYIINGLKQFIRAAKVMANSEKAKYLKELAVQKETVAFV